MFGNSVPKRKYDVDLFNAFQRGYGQAQADIKAIGRANKVLYEALDLIASSKIQEEYDNPADQVGAMQNIAENALKWADQNALVFDEDANEEPDESTRPASGEPD
jgi:hypothetical protein